MTTYRVTIRRRGFTHVLPEKATTPEEATKQAEAALAILHHRPDNPWRVSITAPTATYCEV